MPPDLVERAPSSQYGDSFDNADRRNKTLKNSGPRGARYRRPENPEVTWSGRGQMVGRFTLAVAAGKAAETMAV